MKTLVKPSVDGVILREPILTLVDGEIVPPKWLHYIFDPICAWCYGIDPHMRAAEQMNEFTLVLHGGGLYPLLKPFPNPKGDDVSNFLAEAKKRNPQIRKDTGMPIADSLKSAFSGMPKTARVDSRPAIAAVLAAHTLQRDGMGMLRELQRSFFGRAEPILDKAGVSAVARSLGLEQKAFQKEYDAALKGKVERHIKETRKLLQQVNGQGYPTLALEDADGNFKLVKLTRFDNPLRWASRL